jgi:hypothetical protein
MDTINKKAIARVRWLYDDKVYDNVTIMLRPYSPETDKNIDNEVFYYCTNGLNELKDLASKGGGVASFLVEDFELVDE